MTAKKKTAKKAAKKTGGGLSDADKVRRLEVRNILSKLNSGKTLTARENRILEDHFDSEQEGGKSGSGNRQKDIVESMSAAAARIGCQLEAVKLAKAMGCDAFRPNNRISVSRLSGYMETDEFSAALKENLEGTDAADWDKRLKRAKALQAEHRLAVEQSKAWDAEQVQRLIAAGDSAVVESLRRWLESEQPPLVEGKGAASILSANRKFLDDVIDDLRRSRREAIEELGRQLPDDEEDEQ